MTGVRVASTLYLAPAIVSPAAAGAVIRRRDARGARSLAAMPAAAARWAACDAVEVHLDSVGARRRQDAWLARPWVLAAVWSVPRLPRPVAWKSRGHRWLWTDIRRPAAGEPFDTDAYGWWFWLLTVQHSALMLIGSLVRLRACRPVLAVYRTPIRGGPVAVIIASIGTTVSIFKLGRLPERDWLTLSPGLSGAMLGRMVVNEGYFDVSARAREVRLHTTTDAAIVLDARGRLAVVNDPARNLLGLPDNAARLPAEVRLPDRQQAPAPWLSELTLDHLPGARRWIDVRVDPIGDRWGDCSGWLVVACDVTMRKALANAREQLIAELRRARGVVRVLGPHLPVCARCHCVRDEAGEWREVTPYLRRRDVHVSHGFCPACHGRVYGGAR